MCIYDDVPRQTRCRWFLQHGARARFDCGWRSKDEIEVWIRKRKLDWRCGYTFRVHGDDADCFIVNRKGFLAQA